MAKITTNLADNQKVREAFAAERKAKALQLIAYYLQKKPSQVKKAFFEKLKQRIDKDGFDYFILSNELNQVGSKGLPALFKHWEGAEQSGAAECMRQLWLVATGQFLSDRAVTAMVKKGDLPTMSATHSYNLMKVRIEKLLKHPLNYPESAVKQTILREFVKIKECVAAPEIKAQDERAKKQREAEARYQKAVLDKAIEIIRHTPKLFFDPQGRVLVEVPALTEEELFEINLGDPAVKAALRVSPTGKSTICDVDILSLPQGHKEQFRDWIMGGTTTPVDSRLKPAVDRLVDSDGLSSIIPLQREMTFHLLHTARVLRSKMGTMEDATMESLVADARASRPDDECADNAVWQHIIQFVNTGVNALVQKAYAQALQESLQNGEIDLIGLNQKLDAARAQLAPQGQALLVEACLRWLPREELSKAVKALKKGDFAHTTATGKDYLRSDGQNAIIYREVGTEKTAHDKTYGEEQAFRLINTMRYDAATGVVTPLSEEMSVRGRVPSVAVLDDTSKKTNPIVRFVKRIFKVFGHDESVADVALKLNASYTAISEQLGGYQGPMVYNLLTSLHSKLWDFFADWGNHQRASAARILKGAHQFNAQQIKKELSNSFWYVQNIPVNQHTNNLSYDAYDDATCEATLMTDIALLSTFAQHVKRFPGLGIQENYFQVHEIYKQFLSANPQGDIYFTDIIAARMVMKRLTQFKQSIAQTLLALGEPNTMVDLVTKALLRLYGNNHHWNKQFGMLVQSLSVFVERASQLGCKSAIDRLQGVKGRVLMLESMAKDPLPDNELTRALTQFITAEHPSPEILQQAVDTAYNNSLLYAQATSLEDSGGDAKLRASKNAGGSLNAREIDTNIGESGYLTRLWQKCTKAMQSHAPGAVKRLKRLFQQKAPEVEYGRLVLSEVRAAGEPAPPGLGEQHDDVTMFQRLFAGQVGEFAALHVAARPPAPLPAGEPAAEDGLRWGDAEYNRMRFGEYNP